MLKFTMILWQIYPWLGPHQSASKLQVDSYDPNTQS